MPFCANCGAPVDGRFCAKCGTPAGASARPASDPPLVSGPASAGLSESVACGLCYVLLFITGILFLVLEPYSRNRTVRFHAFQAIFLSVAWFVVLFVAGILFSTLRLYFVTQVLELGFVVLWIYVMVMTFQGRMVVLPVIGPLAQQQAR